MYMALFVTVWAIRTWELATNSTEVFIYKTQLQFGIEIVY